MPISDGDIKLLASERMADTDDGGGRVTGNVIVDGASNNIFPDISELDRTYGRVNLRKVFPAVHTDDTAGYYGAHAILDDAPDDPLVSATLFSTESWTDLRAAAVDRLESYLARGPRLQGYLYDQHIAGQKALLVLMRIDREPPAVGATLVVVKDPGLASEQEQFVRVTHVSSQTMSFDASGCQTFQRQVVTLEISDQLEFDVAGGQPHCQDDTSQSIASRLYTTVVADAARYYGIRPLAQAAATGNLTVRADTIFSPLVPSAQTEIPIVDAKPHGDSVAPIACGGSVTLTTTAVLDPTHALYLGQAVVPGSLTLTGGGHTLLDLDGVLMSGTLQVGLIDYANGVLRIDAGGPAITDGKTIVFQPAASPARNMRTAAWSVTPESRSQTIVAIMDPIPVPASLAVHYMASGRWYVLRDQGSGALRGEDTAYGSGVLNLATGSVSVTLGALPDVGSEVIFTYGVASLEIDRSGGTTQAYQDLQLVTTEALVPNTLSIAWAGKTATDDGAGNLVGDASGTVDYAGRKIRFVPAVLPAGGATLTVSASTATAQQDASVSALSFNLGPGILPHTLRIEVPVAYLHTEEDGGSQNYGSTLAITDDGAGNLSGGRGTVNYATGAVSISDASLSVSVTDKEIVVRAIGRYPNESYNAQHGTYDHRMEVTGAQTVSRTAAWTGAPLTVRWAVGSPASMPDEQFTWDPALDLTPGYAEQIVPGSARIAFAGKTILDRNGRLVMDLDPATGSATDCGAIDYVTGVCAVAGAAVPGQANSATLQGLLTSLSGHPVDEVTFRTAAAPIRPGSLILQFARPAGGGTETVTANTDGTIGGTNVFGTVDYETGIVRVRFGDVVPAAGNEGEWWYEPDDVQNGLVYKPIPVLGETIRYAAVAYTYLPLDADILGLNPVRLPSDGRVPIFAPGYVAVLHHTQRTTGTWANGNVVDLGRARIARVRVLEAGGAVVPASRYSADLDAGTLTWLDVSGLVQPLTIEDRIEDMGLVSDAQINGQLTLTRPITHDYPAPGSFVSSALIVGDLAARYTNLFEQATWTGVWSDSRIGGEPTASYNEIQYPIVVTNRGAIQERWALLFTNSTNFNVVGESVGQIATANTATDCAPLNPATGVPYFTLRALGWGAGWSAGNVLRFNTVAANHPVWIARTIQQGPATLDDDGFTLQIRGDIDA